MNWRKLVWLFFAYLIVEGALRKWVAPSFGKELFVLGDVVLWLGFLGFLFEARLGRDSNGIPAGALTVWIAAFAFWSVVETFNPYFHSRVVHATGLFYYLVFLPLIPMGARLFRSVDELWAYARLLVLAAFPLGVLALVQILSPAGAFINRYVAQGIGIATFGTVSLARATATFSYITPYEDYLKVAGFLALGLLILARTRRERWLMYAALATIVASILMTGSRAPVYFFGAGLAGMVILSVADRSLRNVTSRRMAGAVALALIFVVLALPRVYQAYQQRVTMVSYDRAQRIEGFLAKPFYTLSKTPPLGYGAGATYQGTAALLGSAYARQHMGGAAAAWSDVNTNRIVADMGFVGFVLEMGISATLLLGLYRVSRRSRDKRVVILARVLLLYVATFWLTIPVYEYTAMAFYCLAGGVYLFLKWRVAHEYALGNQTVSSGGRWSRA